MGNRIRAQHQRIVRVAQRLERFELHQVVAPQVDASEHHRIGLQLFGLGDRKHPQHLAVADVHQATVADSETLQSKGPELTFPRHLRLNHSHPKQRGKGPVGQLGLLVPSQGIDVNSLGPRLAMSRKPCRKSLCILRIGRVVQYGFGENAGPLPRKNGRGDPVRHHANPAGRIPPAGILVLLGMLGIFGQLENSRCQRHDDYLNPGAACVPMLRNWIRQTMSALKAIPRAFGCKANPSASPWR